MAETYGIPDAQRQRLLPIVLGLGAVFVVVQVLTGQSRTPVPALAVGAGYLWCALVAFRGGRSAEWLRIVVTVFAVAYLAIQLGLVLFAGSSAAGNGSDFAVVATWAPFALLGAWLLLDERVNRWGAVIAYYLALLLPEAAFVVRRGSETASSALHQMGPLVLASVVLTIVLAELTRLQGRFAASQAAQDVLERMAHTDPLTELPNRRSLMAELTREAAVAARFGLPLAVIEFDLDHFKEINDVYGHQTGDQVLVAVTRHVQRRLRATDVVGRLGGEEFLILAPGNSAAEATRLAEELCQSLRERPMARDRAWVTGSFGVTVYEPGDTGDAILARADAALYAAKRNGRNQVATATRGMPPDGAAQPRDGSSQGRPA